MKFHGKILLNTACSTQTLQTLFLCSRHRRLHILGQALSTSARATTRDTDLDMHAHPESVLLREIPFICSQVLGYHIVPGQFLSNGLYDGAVLETLVPNATLEVRAQPFILCFCFFGRFPRSNT